MWFYTIFYNFAQFYKLSGFADIKQTLHYKVATK